MNFGLYIVVWESHLLLIPLNPSLILGSGSQGEMFFRYAWGCVRRVMIHGFKFSKSKIWLLSFDSGFFEYFAQFSHYRFGCGICSGQIRYYLAMREALLLGKLLKALALKWCSSVHLALYPISHGIEQFDQYRLVISCIFGTVLLKDSNQTNWTGIDYQD